jgi:hypothetical protein
MKVIKKHTPAVTPLKDQFTVGETIKWTTRFFDGRSTSYVGHTGTVVKVNKVTVDVELGNKGVVRLDEWDLATVKKVEPIKVLTANGVPVSL